MKIDDFVNNAARRYDSWKSGSGARGYMHGQMLLLLLLPIVFIIGFAGLLGVGSLPFLAGWKLPWEVRGNPQAMQPPPAPMPGPMLANPPGDQNDLQPLVGKNPPPAFAEPPFKTPPPPEKPAVPALTGDAVLDQWLADLGSGKPIIATQAANKLAAMAPNEQRAVVAQQLAAQVQQRGEGRRGPFLKALGVWATPQEVPVLIQILETNSPFDGEHAIDALGRLKDERAIPVLVRRMRNAFHKDRAAAALRHFGPAAEKEVLTLLTEKDHFQQQAAIKLLGDIGTMESVPELKRIATSDFPLLQGAARQAIAAIQARSKQ